MAADTFTNPLFPPPAGDFWVSRFDGRFYAAYTLGNEIALPGADSISALPESKIRHLLYETPGTEYAAQLWAPELHRLDGVWYIYFTATSKEVKDHRMFALRCRDADPLPDRGNFARP